MLEETTRGRSRRHQLPALPSDVVAEALGVAGEQEFRDEAGQLVRPTMYVAGMDIKTAFDEARPWHFGLNVEDHKTHGRIISALLREMADLEGHAMFESVESQFLFDRFLRQGSVEAPRLWLKMAMQILANVEEGWGRRRNGVVLDLEGQKTHQMCSFLWADNFWIMSQRVTSRK